MKETALQVEKDALQAVIELIDSISRSIEEVSTNKANMVEMASTYRRLVRGTKSEAGRQNFEDLLQVCTSWSCSRLLLCNTHVPHRRAADLYLSTATCDCAAAPQGDQQW